MDFIGLFSILHFHTPEKEEVQKCIIMNKWIKEFRKQIVEVYKMKFETCAGLSVDKTTKDFLFSGRPHTVFSSDFHKLFNILKLLSVCFLAEL